MPDTFKTWVVKDYFTPNIKAEVVLDTLLTPYLPKILHSQYPEIDAVYLTKEMSLRKPRPEQESEDNLGPKIDYVLADRHRDCVYLVELKTTDSSLDPGQSSRYAALTAQGENTFGEILGKRLLSILVSHLFIDLGEPETWTDDGKLDEAWRKIWGKRGNYEPKDQLPSQGGSYSQRAIELIKVKGWAWRGNLRSRKYVYTLGQLMDYLHGEPTAGQLWQRRVELIYLVPRLPKKRGPLDPNIRLAAFVPYFEAEQRGTALGDIIHDIYGGNAWRS